MVETSGKVVWLDWTVADGLELRFYYERHDPKDMNDKIASGKPTRRRKRRKKERKKERKERRNEGKERME